MRLPLLWLSDFVERNGTPDGRADRLGIDAARVAKARVGRLHDGVAVDFETDWSMSIAKLDRATFGATKPTWCGTEDRG